MTQRLSTWCALRCKEPQFWRFLRCENEEQAIEIVKRWCDIKSRSKLDSNEDAAKKFHDLIRKPYLKFTEEGEQ
jgi:hypothetical protein